MNREKFQQSLLDSGGYDIKSYFPMYLRNEKATATEKLNNLSCHLSMIGYEVQTEYSLAC